MKKIVQLVSLLIVFLSQAMEEIPTIGEKVTAPLQELVSYINIDEAHRPKVNDIVVFFCFEKGDYRWGQVCNVDSGYKLRSSAREIRNIEYYTIDSGTDIDQICETNYIFKIVK